MIHNKKNNVAIALFKMCLTDLIPVHTGHLLIYSPFHSIYSNEMEKINIFKEKKNFQQNPFSPLHMCSSSFFKKSKR